MIKTFLKHAIYDTALNTMLDGVCRNLKPTSRKIAVGDVFPSIITPDRFYVNCRIIHISNTSIIVKVDRCTVPNSKEHAGWMVDGYWTINLSEITFITTDMVPRKDGSLQAVGWCP